MCVCREIGEDSDGEFDSGTAIMATVKLRRTSEPL